MHVGGWRRLPSAPTNDRSPPPPTAIGAATNGRPRPGGIPAVPIAYYVPRLANSGVPMFGVWGASRWPLPSGHSGAGIQAGSPAASASNEAARCSGPPHSRNGTYRPSPESTRRWHMDHFDAFDVAHAEFERRLWLVRADQWADPTPCSEWSVRDLVNHVVAGARTYTLLLDGCSRERARDARHGRAWRRPAGSVPVQRHGVTRCVPTAWRFGKEVHAPAV